MSSILPLIFSLFVLVGCGQHKQSSSGSQGVRETNQVTNPDALSQNIMNEDIESIQRFLLKGGLVEFELGNGRTLLTEACFWSKFKTIAFLVSMNADLAFKDRSGKSAHDYGEEDMIIKRILFPNLVLELKKNLFTQTKNNEMVELKKTLAQGPPLNFLFLVAELGSEVAEAEGETILTYCIKNKLEGVLRLLVQPKLELDPNLKNIAGESPLQIAKKLNYTNIEKLLIKLGATE